MNSLLKIFGFFGSLAFFICSLLFTIFCFYKARQSDGKGFVNDVMTDLGGGSFKEHVLNPFRNLFWNILGTIFILVTFLAAGLLLISSGYDNNKASQNNQSTNSVPEVKPQTVSPAPAEVQTSNDKSPSTEKSSDATVPKVSEGETVDKIGQQAVGASSADIFSVCEAESNFISKNNCKWRVCSSDEHRQKDECSNYIRTEGKN